MQLEYSALLFTLIALTKLQDCTSRSVLGSTTNTAAMLQHNTTVHQQNLQRKNASEVAVNSTIFRVANSTVITHIQREKRQNQEVELPFDFDTIHLPCDMDVNGRETVINLFPKHCMWVWKRRHESEIYFRIFKTYQLEGFFFGQYFERLRRFEVDIHTWDYKDTDIK